MWEAEDETDYRDYWPILRLKMCLVPTPVSKCWKFIKNMADTLITCECKVVTQSTVPDEIYVQGYMQDKNKIILLTRQRTLLVVIIYIS